MKTINFTQNDLKQKFGSQCHLKDIIQSIENEFLESGQVVCNISLNNTELSEEKELEFKNTSILKIQHLSFQLENPQTLVKDVCLNWTKMLPDLIKKIETTSNIIRFETPQNSLSSIENLIEFCEYFTASIDSVYKYLSGFNLLNKYEDHWLDQSSKYHDIVKELLYAFEKQDFVLISDILEYDLTDCFNNWLELIKDSLKHVKFDNNRSTTRENPANS